MKLNKVLALALSGVMAVSMLAGCSNNSGNGGQNGEEQPPVTNSVAAQVNDKLTDSNKTKITFSDSADLESNLTDAVTLNGLVNLPRASAVQTTMNDLTGLNPNDYNSMTVNTTAKEYEIMLVRASRPNVASIAALNDFMDEVNTWISSMPYAAVGSARYVDADDLEGANLAEGTVYTQYAYTGDVAMVQATNYAGTSVQYYFVVTIAQTATTAVAA